MAIATVTAPDGKEFKFYVPKGTSNEEALARAPYAYDRYLSGVDVTQPPPPPEATVGSAFKSGLASILSSSRTAIGAALGDEEAAGLAGVERGAEIAQKYGTPRGLEAVREASEDGVLSAAGEVLSQIPQAVSGQLPVIGTLAAGATAGTLMGGPVGGIIGGVAALFPQFMGADIERQVGEQRAAGVADEDIDVDVSKAAAAATAQSAVESVGTAFVLGKGVVRSILKIDPTDLKTAGKLSNEIAREELRNVAERTLTGTVARGAARGLTEMPVEVAQSVIERAQAGLDILSEEALQEYGEAAYQAALVGPVIGAPGEVVTRRAARRQLAELETELTPEEIEALRLLPAPQEKLPAPVDTTREQAIADEVRFGRGDEAQLAERVVETQRGQRELFPELMAIDQAVSTGAKTTITEEDLKALGVKNVKAKTLAPVIDADLTNPEARQAAFDALNAYINNTTVKSRLPEVRRNIMGLMTGPAFADVEVAPVAPEATARQITIEEEITRQERAEDFERAEQARAEQLEADRVMAEMQREAQDRPTATALAMQEAERRGRRVPGQAQLEIPTIPEEDATIRELRAIEQRIAETEQAEPVAAEPAPEQLSMIGPRGGVTPEARRRTRAPAPTPTEAEPVSTTEPAPPAEDIEQAVATATEPTAPPTAPEERTERVAETATAPVTEGVTESVLDVEGDVIEDRDVATAEAVLQSTPSLQERSESVAGDQAIIDAMEADNPAAKYFRGKSLQDGLDALAADMSVNLNEETEAASVWVKENLSKASRLELTKLVREMRSAMGLPLPAAMVARTASSLSPDVVTALENNDLAGAIGILAKDKDPTVSKIAKAISKGIANTKISMVSDLRNDKGEVISGLYNPRTDTISLNPDVSLTTHTLLHETIHAVTSHELAKNTPAARQMRNLFESVREKLDTSYGATNLDEFVAEAFSNPEFQAKLAKIFPDGGRISAWERFKHVVYNIIRKFRKLPQKKLGSAKDTADRLIADLISPTPEYRDAVDLYSATVAQEEAGVLNSLSRFTKGKISEEDLNAVRDYMPGATSLARRTLFYMLPLNSVSDLIRPRFEGLSNTMNELYRLIQKKNGARAKSLTKIRDTARVLEKMFDGKPREARELFNAVVHESTRHRTDPSLPRSFYENYRLYVSNEDGTSELIQKKTRAELDAEIENVKKAKKKYKVMSPNEGQLEMYDQLQKEYWEPLLKMMPEAAKAYTSLRDTYKEIYDSLRRTMMARIAQIEDADMRKTYRDQILAELLNKEIIEPYFPLYRRGDYWLSYNMLDPFTGEPTRAVEAFESDAKRQRRIRELNADTKLAAELAEAKYPLDLVQESRDQMKRNNGNVDERFAYGLLGQLRSKAAQSVKDAEEKALADGKSQEEAIALARNVSIANKQAERVITEAIMNAMPERGLHRALRPRKGTRGYEEDALTVFRERAPGFISQVLNLEYDVPFLSLSNKMQKQAEAYNNTPDAQYAKDIQTLTDEFIDFARHPNLAPWSRKLKSVGFMWTLGINASSAVVNSFILPIVVFPYLGAKYGYGDTFRAMNNARKRYMRTGFKRPVEAFGGLEGEAVTDGPSLTNINFADRESIPESFMAQLRSEAVAEGAQSDAAVQELVDEKLDRLQVLSEVLAERGMANASTIEDMLDMYSPSSTIGAKVNAGMGYMFHQGERFNRQLTTSATYDLILDKKKKDKKGQPLTREDYISAVEEAILETEHTNSGAMTETAPRLSQNSLGSVLLMYKRFGVSMLYLQFRMARDLIRKLPPEERAVAKKQIAGLFASSGLLAGVQGMPLYGAIAAIANMFFLDDEDDDFDSIAADFFGEGPYSGILNATLGVDVAPRIGMTNLVFRSLPNSAEEDLVVQGLELAGGPMFGIARRIERGARLMFEGEIARGLEGITPAAVSNGLKTVRYAREGATTLRGDPIVGDMTPTNLIGQIFGFAPAGYTKQLEVNARNKRIDRKISERKTRILRQRYMALREGDLDGVREADEEIRDFNRRHPETAITGDTIQRSTRQHRITDIMARTLGGITVSRRRYEKVLRDNLKSLGEEDFFE